MPDSMMGKQIDDFIIQERLGQGAMAIVYKAHQPSINRFVALKVIRLDEGQGLHEDFRRRFAREAAVIAGLEHIHILPIYAYGINEEMAYLAMRWLKGGSLSQIMRRERLSIERAADIFNQIAKGLAYAHSKGVIHRDLKPSNIMLDDTGNAYLTDFGLAKLVEGSGEITKTGNIVGTPAYMSPEQLRGETLDYRSDIYSLGVILYNMMVGRLPFDSSTTDLVSVIYQHLEKEPTPPSELNPDIPPAVEVVILKALQKNREERYNSPLEMSNALNAALGRPVSNDSMTDIPNPLFITSQMTLRKTKQFFTKTSVLGSIIGILALALIAVLLIQNISGNNAIQATQTSEALTAAASDATATARFWTATPYPVSKILTGQKWPAEDVIPDNEQITIARNRLGENGFIAFISCNQTSEYHASLTREVFDAASRLNLPLHIYDSENDNYRQVTLIDRARTDGAVGIILCPLQIDLLKESLTAIQDAHFPLVIFSDQPPSYGGVLIGGDNYLIGLDPGRFAGEIIRDEMGGKADVIILDYPAIESIVARANGLEDGVKEFAPDANIIGRYTGGTVDDGKASVAKLIEEGVKFNVIVSINDAGSLGAIQAMQDAGWDCNSVTVVSLDAEALAQQYIREGCFMRGSVENSRKNPAQTMVDAMVQILAGSDIAETIIIPPGPIITKELLEQNDATATAAANTSTGVEATAEATATAVANTSTGAEATAEATATVDEVTPANAEATPEATATP